MKRIPVTAGKSLPHVSNFEGQLFEISAVEANTITGAYRSNKIHNRFEVHATYADGASEWFSVLADLPCEGRSAELAGTNCAFSFQLQEPFKTLSFEFKNIPSLDIVLAKDDVIAEPGKTSIAKNNAVILFDVSDLVYYIGHHDNLTGIQRVQACVLLGLVKGHPEQRREYISYNNVISEFNIIDREFFETLLIDLSRPVTSRTCAFDPMDARRGILPNSYPLSNVRAKPDERLVVHLLGAAWVNRDYFHRILDLKRVYDALFCITIHDLIPIYARETCDQGTAIVFEEFLRKSFLFADHYFTVSAYTAFDLHRYAASLGCTNVPISVIENGHSFDEFMPVKKARVGTFDRELKRFGKDGFVLFVSTIEGRKNHSYIFDVWQELSRTRPNLPVLLCVGRFGWRAEGFVEKMLMTDNLGNKVRVLSDISDAQLEALYGSCLFTVYPSTYEGWGLPVGEALSKGKLCVMSDRSSLPEVAGEFGVYFDIDSVADGVAKVGRLIDDRANREGLETALRENFAQRTWTKVADELVGYIAKLPAPRSVAFPVMKLGQEYRLSQLPPRNIAALGSAMISQVQGARRTPLTGHINRDEDLLRAQASRFGPGWYAPEDWGTWARFPECSRLCYVKPAPEAREVIIYESVRVIGILAGSTLAFSLNDGPVTEYKIEHDRFVIRATGPLDVGPDGLAELQLHYRIIAQGDVTKALDEIDSRRLGLGIESTIVLQDCDILRRLALMETLVVGGAAGRGPVRPVAEARSTVSRRAKVVNAPVPIDTPAETAASFEGLGHERTLDAPKVEIGELVRIGQRTFLRSGLPVSSLLGRGWYPVEAVAVWSNALEATVNFRLPATTGRVFMLRVEFRCLASPTVPVNLSIAINDVLAWSDKVLGSESLHKRFIIDSAVSPYDNAFVLSFHCDRLIAPARQGWGDDSRMLGIEFRELSPEPMPSLSMNVMHDVQPGSVAEPVLVNGWYPIEQSGAWSMAEGGRIACSVDIGAAVGVRNLRLTVLCRVFGTRITGAAVVDLLVQGQVLSSWLFENDTPLTLTGIVPVLEIGDRMVLDITLVRRGAVSPADADGGDDGRRLGLFVYGLALEDVAVRLSTDEDEAVSALA